LYDFVPLFDRYTTPARFGALAGFALVCFLATVFNVVRSERQMNKKWVGIFILTTFFAGNLLVGLVQNIGAHWILRYDPVQVAPLLKPPKILVSPDLPKGAVFDLSCEPDSIWSAYYQTWHNRPIAGFGPVPRIYSGMQEESRLTNLLRGHCPRQDQHPPPEFSPEHLLKLNVNVVILPDEYLESKHHSFLFDFEQKFGEPAETSANMRVYVIDE
jgi:hypothetical protein